MDNLSGKELSVLALLVWFLSMPRVPLLLLIRALKPLHDCMCECKSCGLNSFPHCLQGVKILARGQYPSLTSACTIYSQKNL